MNTCLSNFGSSSPNCGKWAENGCMQLFCLPSKLCKNSFDTCFILFTKSLAWKMWAKCCIDKSFKLHKTEKRGYSLLAFQFDGLMFKYLCII